jgi:hypothetical protein
MVRIGIRYFAVLVVSAIVLLAAADEATRRGQVFDAQTDQPIEEAMVTLDDRVERTQANGSFEIRGMGSRLSVRAYGYQRMSLDLAPRSDGLRDIISLKPFTPKALYLSFYGIGNKTLRESALKIIETTEMNALVIDVKGDRGRIPYKSAVSLAARVGAQDVTTVNDIVGLLKSLREKGIYAIARVVVFKDERLASARADLAVKSTGGAVWHDREGLPWTDPFNKEVWDYNIALAAEAAQYGFDEIQFDYVRFPDARGLVFSMPNTQENRLKAIGEFLQTARKRLAPYNVFVSADLFGYVCWNLDDTGVGQTLESASTQLDYLSPMLYPSGFQFGIPGCKNPVAHPYEIVYHSLVRARERSGLSPVRFRPWLQAFKDYAFDRRAYGAEEIRQQIKAAEDFGSNGWMLWNPRNEYSLEGLRSIGGK